MALLLVLSTFPDKEAAERIGRALVEAGLVACVNVLPGVHSMYRWEGKLESAEEVLAMMKTTEEAYPQLEARLKELHPYEVPEIIAVPLEQVEEKYAKWVADVTGRMGD